jgi:hypothetical protein
MTASWRECGLNAGDRHQGILEFALRHQPHSMNFYVVDKMPSPCRSQVSMSLEAIFNLSISCARKSMCHHAGVPEIQREVAFGLLTRAPHDKLCGV